MKIKTLLMIFIFETHISSFSVLAMMVVCRGYFPTNGLSTSSSEYITLLKRKWSLSSQFLYCAKRWLNRICNKVDSVYFDLMTFFVTRSVVNTSNHN